MTHPTRLLARHTPRSTWRTPWAWARQSESVFANIRAALAMSRVDPVKAKAAEAALDDEWEEPPPMSRFAVDAMLVAMLRSAVVRATALAGLRPSYFNSLETAHLILLLALGKVHGVHADADAVPELDLQVAVCEVAEERGARRDRRHIWPAPREAWDDLTRARRPGLPRPRVGGRA